MARIPWRLLFIGADDRLLGGRSGRVVNRRATMSDVRPYPHAESHSRCKPENKGEPLGERHVNTPKRCANSEMFRSSDDKGEPLRCNVGTGLRVSSSN